MEGLTALAEVPLRIGSFNLEKFGSGSTAKPVRDIISVLCNVLKRYDILLIIEPKRAPREDSSIDRVKKRLKGVDTKNPFAYVESEAVLQGSQKCEHYIIFYRSKKFQVVTTHRYEDGPFSTNGWSKMPRKTSGGTGVDDSPVPPDKTIAGGPMTSGPIRPKSAPKKDSKDDKNRPSPSSASGKSPPIQAVGKKVSAEERPEKRNSLSLSVSSYKFEGSTSLSKMNYVTRQLSADEDTEDDWKEVDVGLRKSVSSCNLLDFACKPAPAPMAGLREEGDDDQDRSDDSVTGGPVLSEVPLPSPYERKESVGTEWQENPIGLRKSVSVINLTDRADYYRKSSQMKQRIERVSLTLREDQHPEIIPEAGQSKEGLTGDPTKSAPSIELLPEDPREFSVDDEEPDWQIHQVGLRVSASSIDLISQPKPEKLTTLEGLAEDETQNSGENNSHPPDICFGIETLFAGDFVVDELNIAADSYRKPFQYSEDFMCVSKASEKLKPIFGDCASLFAAADSLTDDTPLSCLDHVGHPADHTDVVDTSTCRAQIQCPPCVGSDIFVKPDADLENCEMNLSPPSDFSCFVHSLPGDPDWFADVDVSVVQEIPAHNGVLDVPLLPPAECCADESMPLAAYEAKKSEIVELTEESCWEVVFELPLCDTGEECSEVTCHLSAGISTRHSVYLEEKQTDEKAREESKESCTTDFLNDRTDCEAGARIALDQEYSSEATNQTDICQLNVKTQAQRPRDRNQQNNPVDSDGSSDADGGGENEDGGIDEDGESEEGEGEGEGEGEDEEGEGDDDDDVDDDDQSFADRDGPSVVFPNLKADPDKKIKRRGSILKNEDTTPKDGRIMFSGNVDVKQIPNRFQLYDYSIEETRLREQGRRLVICGCCDIPHPFRRGKKFDHFEVDLNKLTEEREKQRREYEAAMAAQQAALDQAAAADPSKKGESNQNARTIIFGQYHPNLPSTSSAPTTSLPEPEEETGVPLGNRLSLASLVNSFFSSYFDEGSSVDGDNFRNVPGTSSATERNLNCNWKVYETPGMTARRRVALTDMDTDEIKTCPHCGGLKLNWLPDSVLVSDDMSSASPSPYHSYTSFADIRQMLVSKKNEVFASFKEKLVSFLRFFSKPLSGTESPPETSDTIKNDETSQTNASIKVNADPCSDSNGEQRDQKPDLYREPTRIVGKKRDKAGVPEGRQGSHDKDFGGQGDSATKLQNSTDNVLPSSDIQVEINTSSNLTDCIPLPQAETPGFTEGKSDDATVLTSCMGKVYMETEADRVQSENSVDSHEQTVKTSATMSQEQYSSQQNFASDSYAVHVESDSQGEQQKTLIYKTVSPDKVVLETTSSQNKGLFDDARHNMHVFTLESHSDVVGTVDHRENWNTNAEGKKRRESGEGSTSTSECAEQIQYDLEDVQEDNDHNRIHEEGTSTAAIDEEDVSREKDDEERRNVVCDEVQHFDSEDEEAAVLDDDENSTFDDDDASTITGDENDDEACCKDLNTNTNADKTGGSNANEVLGAVFKRNPFAVFFQSTIAEVPEFAILVMHTDPSDARKEVLAIQRIYDITSNKWQLENILIAGTFIMDESVRGLPHWRGLAVKSDRRFTAMNQTTGVETVTPGPPAKDRNYDRFVLVGSQLNRAYIHSSVGYFSYDDAFNLSMEEAAGISDHYPVEFQIAGKATTKWQNHVQTKAGVVIEQKQAVPAFALKSMASHADAQGGMKNASMIRITKRNVTNLLECLRGFQKTYPEVLLDTTVSVAASFAASPLMTTSPFYGMAVERDVKYDVTVTVALRHPHICCLHIFRRLNDGFWSDTPVV